MSIWGLLYPSSSTSIGAGGSLYASVTTKAAQGSRGWPLGQWAVFAVHRLRQPTSTRQRRGHSGIQSEMHVKAGKLHISPGKSLPDCSQMPQDLKVVSCALVSPQVHADPE